MGEMKVEHVLLFLVGAFLVYHMMGKCRRVEGYKYPPLTKIKSELSELSEKLHSRAHGVQVGACPQCRCSFLGIDGSWCCDC